MRKTTKLFILLFMGLLFAGVLFACKPNEKFEVVFNLNYEGAVGTPKALELEKDEIPTAPNNPTRSGFTFKGWFDAKTGGTEYKFNVGITENITLYARWEEDAPIGKTAYYVGASFNGYNEKDEDSKMIEKEDEPGVYTFEIVLTETDRDKAYDGHYYKVTNGTWDAEGTWGVDNYYISPAPASPTGGGMGSIWHWANGTLTITWDSNTKKITDTLVISEPKVEEVYGIYGAFNGWAIEGENAFLLEDIDNDGRYVGEIKFDEEVTSDFGFVVDKLWFDDQWGQRWGANTQYKLDGTAAGMGDSTTLTLEAGKYLFVYDAATKITTHMKIVDGVTYKFPAPRLYGEFNGWAFKGVGTHYFNEKEQDGVHFFELEVENALTSDFTVMLSQQYYEAYAVWGAGEQYKLDGNPAGMGNATTLTLEPGKYLFVYNSITHVTTHMKLENEVEYKYLNPRIYGEFNGWTIEGVDALVLRDIDQDGKYIIELEFSEEVTSDFGVLYSKMFYTGVGFANWGAGEQYKFNGTAAGMGGVTTLTLEPGRYLFVHDAITKITTYTKMVQGATYEFPFPRIYGEFNSWAIEGEKAICFETIDENGKYTLEIEITSTITSDFTIVVSKMFYEGEGYAVWGAGEQYKPDGTAAGMGEAMILTLEPGVYIFTYDPETHITTYVKEA